MTFPPTGVDGEITLAGAHLSTQIDTEGQSSLSSPPITQLVTEIFHGH